MIKRDKEGIFSKFQRRNNYFGSTLSTLAPPNVATYKLPSESMVIPSGIKPGLLPFTLKSMRTRSFAKFREN